jgi:hypothetical protein
MAQPVTPHDHIVAAADRYRQAHRAALDVSREIHARTQAERDQAVVDALTARDKP